MGDEPRPGWVLEALALAVVVLGAFSAGVLAERLRLDLQRSDMLRRYDRALREHQEQIIQSEKHSGGQKSTRPSADRGRRCEASRASRFSSASS